MVKYPPKTLTKSIKHTSNKNKSCLTKKAPIKLLNEEQTNPNFNVNLIDHINHTSTYTKEYLQSHDLNNLIQKQSQNISTSTLQEIKYLENHPDIILSQSDKNMGLTLLPTSWFLSEYNRHLLDSTTYRKILNFDLNNHINNCNIVLTKLQKRFSPSLTPTKRKLLDTLNINNIQIPYLKLLPKVHKLSSTASPQNLQQVTGRPFITAHSWTTSNISKLCFRT